VLGRQVRLIPFFVSFLLVIGFALHLVNLGRYLSTGQSELAAIFTPATDAVLTTWMAYCSILLIAGARRFFARYHVVGWRKVVYWLVAFYVTASLPGHLSFLTTGNTSYFDTFPVWFSPIIMTVYVLFIAYFVTLAVPPDFEEPRDDLRWKARLGSVRAVAQPQNGPAAAERRALALGGGPGVPSFIHDPTRIQVCVARL